MSISESILPEFEQEMSSTRKVLQRVPDDRLNWQAHEKSRSIGWVACHLAEIVGWVEGTLTQESWDIAPADGEPYQSPQLGSRQEILELFDANVAAARERITTTPDEEYGKPWSLLAGGETLMTLPKLGVIRRWVINHSIHHRGHLCVYLKLNNIAIPALYGPSSDEQE